MSEDKTPYTTADSEIARIVAADLSADYGPNQRSDAGDLARLVGLEGRVRAVVKELHDLWTVHAQARLKATEDEDPPAFNAAYFKENAYGYAARLLSAALRGGSVGDAADDGGGRGRNGADEQAN